jgi:Skp family chaperone for outer membrane proteins
MFSGFVRSWQFIKLVCFLIIFFIFAQTTPGYAKDVRIGVIDIQAAVSNTKEWKREFASFKTKFQKEKVSITLREKQLKKIIVDLNKKSMVLSPELKKKKEDALMKKKKDFERYV